MTTKCLILCSSELMGAAVEQLCKTETDLDVINAQSPVKGNLTDQLNRYQPDVLVVDENVEANNPARLLQTLAVIPKMRVIVLNNQTNILHVYKKQDVLVNQVSDFISAVCD